MKKYLRKTVFVSAIAFSVLATVPTTSALAFGLPSFGGGSSEKADVNWEDLATNGSGAEKDIYAGVHLLVKSSQTMAEALGYKQESAALKAQVEAVSKDGSISGGFDLDEAAKSAGSVYEKMSNDKDLIAGLDADQKALISKSMGQYAVGGARYVKGVKAAKDIVEKAKDAPMTQMSKFSGIIKLAPAAASGAKEFFGKIPQVVELLTTEDIALPDNMDDFTGDMLAMK